MSDDEPDIETPENPTGEKPEPMAFEEIPNLFISGHLNMYGSFDIEPQQRSRGMLSKTDREYLLGLKDYKNKQSEANRRQDIRDRIKNTLQDFKIVWTLLEEHDRDQVFTSLGDETVDDSIEAIISFVYLGLNQDIPRIEEAIKRGILAGENVSSEGETKQVDVSINIDYYPDVEDAKEKVQNNPLVELTVEEIGVLAKANELKPSHIEKMNDSSIHIPPNYTGPPHDKPRAEDAQGNEPEPPSGDFDPSIDDS
jgi:hypothetical protein